MIWNLTKVGYGIYLSTQFLLKQPIFFFQMLNSCNNSWIDLNLTGTGFPILGLHG